MIIFLGALYRVKRFRELDWDVASSYMNSLPSFLHDIILASGIPDLSESWIQMTGLEWEIHKTIYKSTSVPTIAFPRVGVELSENSASVHNTPRIRLKSDILKAQKPFSLEASTLKAPLRELAKNHVASAISQKDNNCSEVDRVIAESQHV